MNHRHLLDNEIDLLLDGEVGFGVAPLRAHVAECASCRAAVDRERAVFEALERIPHLAPSANFASRVMAETRVFEPWHITALDAARRWVPSARPARVAAAFAASIAGILITTLVAFALSRADQLAFFTRLGIERTRTALLGAGRDFATASLGSDAVSSLSTAGMSGFVALAVAAAATAVLAAVGFRSLAVGSRARKE